MEWSDRLAVAVLDSLLHISGEIAFSVHRGERSWAVRILLGSAA